MKGFSFKKLNYTEPAILRGIVAAILALLASVGITASTDVTEGAEVAIVTLVTVLPLVQAVWTRLAVFSPKSKDQAVAAARTPVGTPQRPGVADHGAQ